MVNDNDFTTDLKAPKHDDNEGVDKSGHRPKPIFISIEEWIRKNWVMGVMSLVLFLCGYFAIDAKIEIAKLFTKTEGLDQTNDRIISDINNIKSRVETCNDNVMQQIHQQGDRIKEVEVKLELYNSYPPKISRGK